MGYSPASLGKGSVDIAGKGASRQTVYMQWENDMDDYVPQEADARVTLTDGSLHAPIIPNRTSQMLRRIDENKINYELIQLLLEHICFPKDRRQPGNQDPSQPSQVSDLNIAKKLDASESSLISEDNDRSQDPSKSTITPEDTQNQDSVSVPENDQEQHPSQSALQENHSQDPSTSAITPEEGTQNQDSSTPVSVPENVQELDSSQSALQGDRSQDHSQSDPKKGDQKQDPSKSTRVPEETGQNFDFPGDFQDQDDDWPNPFHIPKEGAILVFLPGMPEIRKVYDTLKANRRFADESRFSLWPLHSSISSEGQSQVFDIPPPGVRKIVLATNIAETGITIPDVTIVIDTGKAKQIKYDEKKKVSNLQERFISRASARQRRGRAGRVQEGVCFHLYSNATFNEYMPEFQQPEIMRMPLEELCLMIKMCGLGDIMDVLRSALDAPTTEAIENAILALQEVHALDEKQELTALGTHLCNLPVDVHIGKMILFGAIFKCLDPILTIAAMLSFKSPFVKPFGAEAEADAAKARFKLADSDMLTWFNAYLGWRKTYQEKTSAIYDYCRENFLSHQNLTMIEDMKKQFLGFLVGTGFVKVDFKTRRMLNQEQFSRRILFCPVIPEYNIYERSIPVLNAAITAGMYPKVMMRNDTLKAYVTGSKQEMLWIHPSSVNHTKGGASGAVTGPDVSPWFVYNSLVKSSRMYVWESCRVGQFPLVLFGREMLVKVRIMLCRTNWQQDPAMDSWTHRTLFDIAC